jgi:TolB-like protein
MGDGVLVEFASAVNAVQWAIDVQKAVRDQPHPEALPGLTLRIGINVEDVIDDGGLLQGDGVNIAARIHQAAAPGQIVVTAHVRDYVLNRLAIVLRDLGTPMLKNILRQVRVYSVEWMGQAAHGTPAAQPHLQWSTRPTVAVLPFRTVGGTEVDRYFGEGITEDIITGLSQSRALYVIARTSTLHYRDRTTDLRQIAAELDVRYVLDGSVRRRGDQLRISAELTDVTLSRAVWSERYDGTSENLFEFQDRIASCIVGALEPGLQAAEAARIRERPTDSLDAYDCVLKAASLLYRFTPESYRLSAELLDRAVELDPDYAQAHAWRAWRLNFWCGEGLSPCLASDQALALATARRAAELDPGDAFVLAVAGHVVAFLGRQPEEAEELFASALAINENSAFAWALSALTLSYLGHGAEAMDRLRNAWRLSPFDPLNFYFWIAAGIAEFVSGRYTEAVAWLRKSHRANGRFVAGIRMLAASLALAGEVEAAREAGRALLAADPHFSVARLLAWYPFRRTEDLQRLGEGLRLAGLPD